MLQPSDFRSCSPSNGYMLRAGLDTDLVGLHDLSGFRRMNQRHRQLSLSHWQRSLPVESMSFHAAAANGV